MITDERRAGREANWCISAAVELGAFIETHRARTKARAAEVLAVVGQGQRGRRLPGLASSQCVTLHQLNMKHKEVQLIRLKVV